MVWVLLDEKAIVTASADTIEGLWPQWNADGADRTPDTIDLIAEGITIGSYSGADVVAIGEPLPQRELATQTALW